MPDGKSYLTYQRVGNTSEIRRLDAATGRVLETWHVPARHHVIGFSPEGRYALMTTRYAFSRLLALGGRKKDEQEWVLTLYDLAKRKAVWTNREKLDGPDWKSVDSARFSTDGKWIATAGGYGSGALRLWDARTGRELWNIPSTVQSLKALGFLDGGKTLVLRGGDNTIYLFERATGKQRRSFPTLPRAEECGLAPDGSAVLFSEQYNSPSVRVWDIATGKERPALDGHKKWTRWFPFSPDGKTVVTGGNDPFVLVRDWPAGKVVRTIDLGRGDIQRMTVAGAPPRLEVLFWGEQALHFYDLKTGKEGAPLPESHQSDVYGAALAPDGKLLSFSKDATIRTWDLKTGKVVGRLAVEQDLNGSGCAVSRDGRLLAVTGSEINTIHVYERATGTRIRKLTAEKTLGKHLVFSPNGRYLARADRFGGAFQVWDVSTGRQVAPVADGITCTFSPDGHQFAASDNGLVRFWDVRTWKEQAELKVSAPLGLAYTPDGRTLAAADVEGIRLIEVATQRERVYIRVKGYPAGVLQFSPAGRWLAWTCSPVAQRQEERLRWPPAGTIGTIFVWDVRRGVMLGSFTGHDDTITGLVFTADDRALVSSSADSTMLAWDIAGRATRSRR
jgi:WD40 repeat protein